MANLVPEFQKTVKEFRSKHGNTKVGEVTVDMMYGGMRGIKGLVTETSVLDPDEGIRFRGYSIPECQKLLPTVAGGKEMLPEGLFWLLLTGDIPTDAQVKAVSKEWANRADLPAHVVTMLKNFPSTLHPMAQFSAAITACNHDSKFKQAYTEGVRKNVYWEFSVRPTCQLSRTNGDKPSRQVDTTTRTYSVEETDSVHYSVTTQVLSDVIQRVPAPRCSSGKQNNTR
ncbi:hypothetical protein NP493_6206g00003 [Ridgeia piscesae]|uniref:Citrate synthase n=1 Tax=Ridgeia piscesae TaxID=27915 RepID=A0AAD9MMI0_RIDPI|nr:hypothetical protein NP493_6206g00003 [Ridgeia piscesae]